MMRGGISVAILLCGAAACSPVELVERILSVADGDAVEHAETTTAERKAQEKLPTPWPPRVGEPYPDVELFDQEGKLVRLSSFRGKVLIIEPVGMSCRACNSLSGAKEYGPFPGAADQKSDSFEKILDDYVPGVSLDDERIVFVQILFYSLKMQAPTKDDAKKWADHFEMKRERNEIVLAGTRPFINRATYNMIPGFQVVDKDFVLRFDSTGHRPRHDLFSGVLPGLRKLVRDTPKAPVRARGVDRGGGDVRPFPTEAAKRAYARIPHRQTTYNRAMSPLDAADAAALESMFRHVDDAVVERVAGLAAMHDNGAGVAGRATRMLELADQIERVTLRGEGANASSLIAKAVREQARFFQANSRPENAITTIANGIGRDSLVRAASGKLRVAHQQLLRAYAGETSHNKKAFFDHLCALDFI